MDRRAATLLLTLVLWPTLVGCLQDALLPAAKTWGQILGRLYLSPAPEPEPDIEPPVEFEVPEEPPGLERPEEASVGPAPSKPKVYRGIRISRQTVLRLARARAIPSGTPVAAAWPRPPGLVLGDVGHLGLGVRDGDVLTEVMGVPALNRGVVIATVVRAREKRLPVVSAEFWRGNQRFQLHVEMPYPSGAATAAPSATRSEGKPFSGEPTQRPKMPP